MTRSRYERHGATDHPLYSVWKHMRRRCSSPNEKGYQNYGGRGIRVCKRWEDSFAAFLEDMGERPAGRHELERIDNDGHYEPENCRWATATEQKHNQRPKRACKTGVPGVFWKKERQKYSVTMRHAGRRMWLGEFSGLDDAIAARRAAEIKFWGGLSPWAARK